MGITFGKNDGKQILETGSKTRDLNGFAGGSRLSYPRNFTYYGLNSFYVSSYWNFLADFQTTGHYKRTGTARNEDFFLNEQSQIETSGLDLRKNRFRDTPYSISGSRNFAEAQGNSNMSSWKINAGLQFFPWIYFSSNQDANQEGFFLNTNLQYSWFKYYIYDAIQWIRTSRGLFMGPIGYGNSFSNAQLEFPVGLGYKIQLDGMDLAIDIQYNSGYNTARDFHKQRALNFFIEDAYASGYNLNLVHHYYFKDKKNILKTRLFKHHYYSEGTLTTRGGLGSDYLIGLMGSSQGVQLSTKEAGVEASIMQKF